MEKKKALREILIKEKYSDCTIALEVLLSVISNKEYNLKDIGYKSSGGVANFTKRNFPDKPRTNIKLCTYLLNKYNLKYCPNCNNVKEKWEFNTNNTRNVGVNCWCRDCMQKHQKSKPEKWRNYSAIRRLKISQAKPLWQTQEELEQFYKKCPIGYQVDHIIPITHEKVSGLHCIANLQYLTKQDNQIKSNKFMVGS